MNRGGRINSRVIEGTRFPMTGSEYRKARRMAQLTKHFPDAPYQVRKNAAASGAALERFLAKHF